MNTTNFEKKGKSDITVAMAMSGGVDSSVSCALLKEQGYKVIGFFMKNWGDTMGLKISNCPWKQDREDAMRVASKLDIPFHTLDFEKEYQSQVLDYFFAEYEAGRTPNPDILCNSKIKFGVFLDEAMRLGADYIATGHYARTQDIDGKVQLLKGADTNKDQSYFLYRLNHQQLSKAMFPVGEYTKPHVRELAKKFNLPNHNKRDSQGVCFIGKLDLKKFLSQKIKDHPGDIIDSSGQIIGKHTGLFWYTIGQRKGINIGGTGPYYVIKKDLDKNELVVSNNSEDQALFLSKVFISDVSWISGEPPENSKTLEARIRYREKLSPVTLKNKENGVFEVNFSVPQWAVCSGQSVVFYEADACLGGGIING
ncbi:MAG: tRNA 2-thiouridine(34) synthase MnmA [Parcubacteria group bacterium CG_4_9_14_0_2_um_filter_41_8]|nr:MAG: tRNA 2-thiouridine(34) synthase MnmA [Parcubacteria group bacterium CG1_02_41_12]PIQ80401.1 MAG: tRNA 2-thiouridine(34) synthase MnmA [Parcubacteria group bacterium CG11_big_fil_rev_8_21_14_0_20_41_14]PJC41052.1 MAG: tRNA 2-thiouridine(34) synthase MnmA [Parcubacteria group bacterium CG_4_9_14_0_2_um_filter_41_8]